MNFKFFKNIRTNEKISRSISFLLVIIFLTVCFFPVVSSNDSLISSITLNERPLADIDPPQFGTNFTKKTANTGDAFNFTINVSDNAGIQSVHVNYTWPGAGQFFNNSMINISGNWTNITVMPTINTTITYHFWTIDINGNWNLTSQGFVTVIDNDPPTIISGSGNFTIGTGNNFVIFVNFTDNVNVTIATIYYRNITSAIFSSFEMNEGNEGQFIVTNIFLGIDTSNDDTDYQYYVIAKDTQNNSVNYTFNQTNNIPWSIKVIDDDSPSLLSSSGNFTIDISTQFIIYANFSDNLGTNNVREVWIYYKNFTAGTYSSFQMQKTGPGQYQIMNNSLGIDTTNDDSDYLYHFWVNDTNENNATLPINHDYRITVIDNIDPIVVNGSGDIISYCSTGFTIYANFSDNINVNHSIVYFAYEYNSTYQNSSMTEGGSDGQFFITNVGMGIDVYSNITNLTYYVIAYDNSNNSVKYNDTADSDWNITVIDDVAPIPESGSGDFEAETGKPFWIWSNFTDNIDIINAVIYFKQEMDVNYCSINMTSFNNNGNYYVTSDNITQASCIDPYHSATPIVYYALAIDPFNNVGNYSNSGADWKITVIDVTPPEIINVTGDFTTTTGESFIIYGNFTDNINISHADLFFKQKTTAGSSTTYSSVPMLETPGKKGQFYITDEALGINTYIDDRDILYHFKVYDEAGQFSIFRKPSLVDYKITIFDNDKPWVESGNENISIGTGEEFHIFANFTDNINIDYIKFYYRQDSWSYWFNQEFHVEDTDSDKIWEFHISSNDLETIIDTTKDESDYFYYIRVYDGNKKNPNVFNYSYGATGYRISVIDDDSPTSAKPKGSGNFITTTGESFFIYANFTDNIKVDFATIFIRLETEDSTWPDGINMTELESSPGKFKMANSDLGIDTTNDDSDFEYYVICFDTSTNDYLYDDKSDPFKIQVIDNDKPIADAGANQEVEEDTVVYFNANKSKDNIDIISYKWEFTYSNIEKELEGVETSFKFEKEGNFRVFLIVRDEAGNEAKDIFYINVTIRNFPPIIVDVKPMDGEKIYVYAVKDSEISVRFNESIYLEDKNMDNIDFFYMEDSNDNIIEGTYNWDDYSNKLKFTPSEDLKYAATYRLTVTTNVTDMTGLQLVSGKIWSFTTHLRDSDGDNLDDEWEIEHFGRDTDWVMWITQIGPAWDPDNDEFTNLEEFNAGTDPDNSKSHPSVKEEKSKDTFNYFLNVILFIIVIIILIIIIMAFLVFRKRKAEEEEKRRPTPIEHEILFDEGGGDLGPYPEPGLEPKVPTGSPQASETETKEEITEEVSEKQEEIKIEPELETPEFEEEDIVEQKEPELDIGDTGLESMDIEEEVDQKSSESLDDLDLTIESKESIDEQIESEIEEEAIDMESDTNEIINNYIDSGRQFFDQENYSEAIIEWQKVLELVPDHPEVLKLINDAMEKLKE